MDENRPLLSVVTVTHQDLRGLDRTLRSLRPLVETAGPSIEVLVQDGGTPGVNAVVRESLSRAFLDSRTDAGIYDAMNKALARSCGRHVWFLNGGDRCVISDWEDLSVELLKAGDRLLLWDYFLDVQTRLVRRRARPMGYIFHGLPTSHQAIIYPGAQARAVGYPPQYSIVGDYAITAQLFRRGVDASVIHKPLAAFTTGGTSQLRARQLAREATRVQRDTLESPLALRIASRALHAVARLRRSRLT